MSAIRAQYIPWKVPHSHRWTVTGMLFFPLFIAAQGWEDNLLTHVNTMAKTLNRELQHWPVPYRIFQVEEQGAVADGSTLNTVVIQRTIDACAEAGGVVVLFGSGKYLTGTLYLKSNVMLQVDQDAVILGSRDHERDYPATQPLPTFPAATVRPILRSCTHVWNNHHRLSPISAFAKL